MSVDNTQNVKHITGTKANDKRANTSTTKNTGVDGSEASSSSDYTATNTSQSNSSYTNPKKLKLNENNFFKIIQQEDEYFKLVEEGDVNNFKKMKKVNLVHDRDKDLNTYLHR
jgi:hypothetical protein